MNINQLKSQLEAYEEEKASRMADFANNNSQLTELKDKLQQMITKTSDLAQVYENKKLEAQELCNTTGNDVNAGWGQEVPSNVDWPTSHTAVKISSTITKFRYRCLYAFHARNADELTIEPGDIILVNKFFYLLFNSNIFFDFDINSLFQRWTLVHVQNPDGFQENLKGISVGFLKHTLKDLTQKQILNTTTNIVLMRNTLLSSM
jgi:hypothetical protein